ncbi:MAG: ATP-dependent Clp protease ATP-binding subunit [Clostridia bacterium]|nr:ATP-dependent Clp protease ATP-binding subunit [Clostridia bacterium]
MDRFTKKAALALGEAMECAGTLGHTYIGSEHLLLGILRERDSIGARLLLSRGITFEKAERKVVALVGRGTPRALSAGDMTPRARRIIEQSFSAARRYGQTQVGTEHLLAALLREHQCTAAAVIEKMGADAAALSETVTEKLRLQDPMGEGRNKAPKMLQKYSVSLTAKAALGQLDPLIGREKELERLMVILCRRSKNNPCLIGQPGVGKTVLAEGLAAAIVAGTVPPPLLGKQVYQLELTAMVAGTKYRGEFEERIRSIVEECEKNPEILLFIDEVHTIMGAGAAEGAVDAANILKPALSRGKIRLIGATTLAEYRKYIEKDSALERRFAPLMLKESTPKQTHDILCGLCPRLEEHHRVDILPEALEAAVEYSVRYLHDRFLPDKAIDVLDEACSAAALGRRSPIGQMEVALAQGDFSLLEQQHEEDIVVDASAVASVVSGMTGIPAGNIAEGERGRLGRLEERLNRNVIGQTEAVKALAGAVRCARMGLGEEHRPGGCFLFAGPTGVGKTKLCKELSLALFESRDSLIKLDMSEYMEKHSVSRLIGAPPGYVGHESGGKLIDEVRTHPYSVVLFDEIEKAHPDVTALLLQIMEDGILTDGNGKSADFRHTIIVLTSNIGGDGHHSIGFGEAPAQRRAKLESLLRGRLSPELVGRLDEIIQFAPLSSCALEEIAVLMLSSLRERLEKEGYPISFAEDIPAWVASAPDTALYGARPLRNFIHRNIEIPLSVALLTGDLPSDGIITRQMLNEKLTIGN